MLIIAEQYASAIARRGREATCPDFLAAVWAENGAYFVRQGKNFLILRKVGAIYFATHFAPATMIGGYRLLRRVYTSGLPIFFAVPLDLAEDLSNIGWVRLPAFITALAISNGMPSDKFILAPGHSLKTTWKCLKSAVACPPPIDSSPPLIARSPRIRKPKGPTPIKAKLNAARKPLATLSQFFPNSISGL